MTFSAKQSALIVPVTDATKAYWSFIYALRSVRKASGRPLIPHVRPCLMDHFDHAESGIMKAAKDIGIDMGAEWSHELDLTEK